MTSRAGPRDGRSGRDRRDHANGRTVGSHPSTRATDVIGARIGAQVIDLVIQFVQIVAVAFLLVGLFGPTTRGGVVGLTILTLCTLPLYGAILESQWDGRTVGKVVAGIEVVDGSMDAPTFGQALLRNLPAIIVFSWVAIAVALASIATTSHNQRLFDRLAGTYVVRR